MTQPAHVRIAPYALLFVMLVAVTAVYWPGLYGGWLFDDYPNIVDNQGVQARETSIPSLVRAALSSPSSEFKRPLASLSFAANYLTVGLNPFWWKLTNLVIHLLNGLLMFWLARMLLGVVWRRGEATALVGAHPVHKGLPSVVRDGSWRGDNYPAEPSLPSEESASRTAEGKASRTGCAPTGAGEARITSDHATTRAGMVAALIAGAWMLLPINLTGVLYVVQRMESMANAFVLLGLIGYVAGRRRMLLTTARSAARSESDEPAITNATPKPLEPLAFAKASTLASITAENWGFILCAISITIPAAVGILAKETAVMLPLYALLIEWALFGFASVAQLTPHSQASAPKTPPRDRRIITLFGVVLALPLLAGLAWLVPHVLDPATWATRDFTLGTRLLTEARIVVDYIVWTLVPTPGALSFYHDNFVISTGLLAPWTTSASILCLVALTAFAVWVRARRPLVALGIVLFLGCQLLTGTILPLELIYEHRNYFASFGLLLALMPLLVLAAPRDNAAVVGAHLVRDAFREDEERASRTTGESPLWTRCAPAAASTSAPARAASAGCIQSDVLPLALPRYILLVGLLVYWTALTAVTAYAWGNPLRLAEALAARAPESPRAQYELGRTYILYSHYDPTSPFTALAYAPLEAAAQLPKSSILPQQALIFMNARMQLPLRDAWWDSMITKLATRSPGVQDESSLAALAKCAREQQCNLPHDRMVEAFTAALAHPNPNARLLATYGDYAWNVLGDHELGEQMTRKAVIASPDEPAYQITLVRMLSAQGRNVEARERLQQLKTLNIGGRLNEILDELRALPNTR